MPFDEKNDPREIEALRTEVRELRQALEAATGRRPEVQKLESLSVLAGGIAQDFNNLLLGILAHAGLARKALSTPSSTAHVSARENIEQVEATAMQAANLAKKLLAFSGRARLSTERVDLAHALHDLQHVMRGTAGEGVEFELNLTSQLPLVEADPDQIRQLMLHLLTNAADALEDGVTGRIAIGTGIVELEAADIDGSFLPEKLDPGRYIYITVADNGRGLDRATLQKIFDPFFTTKSSGQGLGLAAVLGIMQGHRGALQVESKKGAGTTFKVYFPCAPAKPPQPVPRKAEETGPAAATILVVDDDDTVRRVTRKILVTAGYGVITAGDGLEAINKLKEHGKEIALALLDMRMPRMGGAETFHEIRRLQADLPVIVSSGYDPQEGADALAEDMMTSFLPKPYSPQDLTARVNWLVEATQREGRRG